MSDTGSPSQYRAVGIALAIGSGALIGTSFVFKKKGLLKSQAGHAAGEGVAYLKSPMWWTGMIMMICGELCNFGAYAFVEAIVVTPLGALSVVISAILSHIVLKEKLTLFGWVGCTQCIIGAILISLNAPGEQSVSTIDAFKKLFLAPGFLSYGAVCIATALAIIFFVAPKYGKKSMIWYILICSIIGGISVSCTQGLGACILTSIRGQNQFKNWFIYFLLIFVACTLLTEIFYLNVALALFNTAMVTPTYYVLFTFFTLVTSIILYQGLKASASTILTIALSFLVICTGIFILQLSKIDPRHLSGVDRKTSILLQAAREEVKPTPGTNGHATNGSDAQTDEEKQLLGATEEPSLDAVAGRFSGLGGAVVRARRRTTLRSGRNESTDSTVRAWPSASFRSGRPRADTSASAPNTSAPFARSSMQSGATTLSELDAAHARYLHDQWRAEANGDVDGSTWRDENDQEKEKKGPGGVAVVSVESAEPSFENKRSGVDGLPFNDPGSVPTSPSAYTRNNGGTNSSSPNASPTTSPKRARVLHGASATTDTPTDPPPFVASPATTSMSEIDVRSMSQHSVHFDDQAQPPHPSQRPGHRRSHSAQGAITTATTVNQTGNALPSSPPRALLSALNTSLPSLHLPTPSIQMPSFFMRSSSRGSSRPSPIKETSPQT